LLHFLPQHFWRRPAAADCQKKLSQPLQFGAEYLSGRCRLPRCWQVEQKCAALSVKNRRVKTAPQLVAGRRKNHGRIRLHFGKPDRSLRKRADAGGKRQRAALEIFCRPDAARLQAVRPDPFGGNPRAGEENVHFARRFYLVFSATMRPWMIFPAWASD
jgi:hypothetical protein